MADMTDNPDVSGTDQATPEHDDTASEWDYYDPDEDTVETPDDEATDDGEPDEDEDPESEDQPDDEGEDEDTAEDEQSAEAVIELPNGEKVAKDELINGYLRQSDYTRKTTEVAERRRSVQAEAQRINDITETFIDFITANVPDEPSIALAQTNPAAYTAQKAAYDATLRQVQALVQQAQTAKKSAGAMTNDQRMEIARAENERLAKWYPETATPQGRQKFFGAVGDAAQFYGFTEQEMNTTLDSRIMAMAHDAAQWQRSQQQRANAKAKVQKAPKAAPVRPGGKGAQSAKSRDAMARFKKTRSIHDAVAAWDGES